MLGPVTRKSSRQSGLQVAEPGRTRGPRVLSWPVGTELVSGHEAVLARAALMRSIAELTGQSGAADDLPYFLSLPDAKRKIPHLLLTRARGGEPSVHGFKEAVFLFEYRNPFGRPASVFTTSDSSGRRTVFAPVETRARTAAQAASFLVARGAHLAHIAFQPSEEFRFSRDEVAVELHSSARFPAGNLWALRELDVPLYLPLEATFDATLARIGQRTRSNLRYYRRRTERDLGARFIAEISAQQLPLGRFLEFNRTCMFAVPDEEAKRRYEAMSIVERPVFCGVRDRQGEWLSLAGGRRRTGEVEIDWQMNREDLPMYSLCIVLRSFLIESEIGRGTQRLYIEGGTPHPIRHSFTRTPVTELTVRHRSLYSGLLTSLAARVYERTNYLAQVLRNRELSWHPW